MIDPRSKDQRSPVDIFRHNGKGYEHVIYCADDDRIECRDLDTDALILTFNSRCDIFTPDGKTYGRISLKETTPRMLWVSEVEGKPALEHNDLLKLEVLVSQQYLDSIKEA